MVHLSNQLPIYNVISFRYCLQYLVGGPWTPDSQLLNGDRSRRKVIKTCVTLFEFMTKQLVAETANPTDASDAPKDAAGTPREPTTAATAAAAEAAVAAACLGLV